MVYQEQVMQIANLVAGYSLGEADLLRRAMGKKKQEEMDAQRVRFLQGAEKKKIQPKRAEKVFDQMAKFAGYGFNKSHSAAYAYLAYITAYLKANYPLDFMSALLTSETGNTAKVVKYINECREMGFRVLPPDVNKSGKHFTPDGENIRFGLSAVKNVGEHAVDAIVAVREEKGAFTSLFQLCEGVDIASLNSRVLESLIKAGAMDSLPGTRSQKLAALPGAMEAGQRKARDRASGQVGLFGGFEAEADAPEPPLPDVSDLSDKDKLAGEKEMLGFYVTGHPLDQYADKVSELATHRLDGLEGLAKGTEVKVCGILTRIVKRRTKDGKPWTALAVEDWNGSLEAMVFSSQYDALLPELVEDRAALVRATVMPEEGGPPKLNIQDIVPLEKARVNFANVIGIRVRLGHNGNDRAEALRELFARKPGPTQVRLILEKPRDFTVTLDVPATVKPDKEFKAEIERICGPETLETLAG
jgi:DNA polymerase-3 subunit alpha